MLMNSQGNKGFTLLELLVAIAIFVVMSFMAYSGLSSVLESRQLTDKVTDRIAAVQMAVSFMQRDLEQALDRNIRDEFGSPAAAFLANELGDLRLEFSRHGYPNPAELSRSHIQRVGYVFEDETLYRQYWAVLDRAQDSVPARDILVEEIKEVSFRFLDTKNQWHVNWPPVNTEKPLQAGLPKAVEFSLSFDDLGKIRRLIALSSGST